MPPPIIRLTSEGQLICSRCRMPKSLELFSRHKKATFGRAYVCKECVAEIYKLRNGASYSRQYYINRRSADPDWKPWTKVSDSARRSAKIRRRYGLSLSEYEALYISQGMACAICRRDKNNVSRNHRLSVDHNHRTGMIRGLLCNQCNLGLGVLESGMVPRYEAYLGTEAPY